MSSKGDTHFSLTSEAMKLLDVEVEVRRREVVRASRISPASVARAVSRSSVLDSVIRDALAGKAA